MRVYQCIKLYFPGVAIWQQFSSCRGGLEEWCQTSIASYAGTYISGVGPRRREGAGIQRGVFVACPTH